MAIIDRIIETMKNKGFSQKEMAIYLNNKTEINVTQTTVSDWKSGKSNSYLTIISNISDFLNVSCDYLIKGENNKDSLSKNEQEIIRILQKLHNDSDQSRLLGYADCYVDYIIQPQKIVSISTNNNDNKIKLPYFDLPASAGTGQMLDDCEYFEYIYVSNNALAQQADFVIRVNGESMLPVYNDGDRVYVQKCNKLNYGDIGIFVVNNDGYIKEFAKNELISLNKNFNNIVIKEYDVVRCIGKVIGKL